MKKFLIFLLSILTSFCIYSESILKEIVGNYGNIKDITVDTFASINYTNTNFLLVTIISIALLFFYHKYINIKKKKAYNILSFIFSLLLVFGYSYSLIGNSSLVTGSFLLLFISCIKLIVYYYFLSTVINIFSKHLKEIKYQSKKEHKLFTKFKNYYELHPYKVSLIIIFLAWLPYLISFYPAILSPDPSNQIKQYYGIETHYITGVNLIDENVLITNHHPVFHTFILGGFTKLGDMMGSLNFGLFMFTCFQMMIMLSAMIYSLVYLKKIKIPFIYRFIILMLYAFVPVFPLYTMSPVKDTMFGALLMFLIIEIHKLITQSKYSWKEYIILSLLLLMMMLVRNNGIYIIVLSALSLIFMLKEKRRALILVLLSSVFVYVAHNKILLPSMHITMGSIREMLSVPFQQTARYVKYYSEDLTKEEIKAIDKILGYDTLKDRYQSNIVDPVKNEFNKDTTTEDLIAYFKVWFSCFLRHPVVYINATIDTVYGYFYPNTTNWYVYHNYDKRLKQSSLDYHYNKLENSRKILESFAVAYPYIPILGSQVNIGFNIWIYMYLITYLIVEHKKKLIPLLLPAFILLLTCVVGPVNTYFRYMFPLVLTLPLLIGMIYQEKGKITNKK